MLSYLSQNDENADGVAESSIQNTWGFDGQDKPSQEIIWEDTDGDGVADISYTKNWSNLYDVNGVMLAQEYTHDVDSDGSVDITINYTWTYDSNGDQDSELIEEQTTGSSTTSYREWNNGTSGEEIVEYTYTENGIEQIGYMSYCAD